VKLILDLAMITSYWRFVARSLVFVHSTRRLYLESANLTISSHEALYLRLKAKQCNVAVVVGIESQRIRAERLPNLWRAFLVDPTVVEPTISRLISQIVVSWTGLIVKGIRNAQSS
jgi:hypothetical protein